MYQGSTVLVFAFGLLCWDRKIDLVSLRESPYVDIQISKLSFFQAKCNVGLVYELINEIKQASRSARSYGNQQAALSFKEFAKMLSENVQVLDQYPECTLQQSANFPDSSAPAKAAQVNNVVFLRIHSIMLCSPRGSPRIRKFKTVGFWNLRHGFWIPGTRSCIPCQWNLILDSNV